jgi:hypothetical protein
MCILCNETYTVRIIEIGTRSISTRCTEYPLPSVYCTIDESALSPTGYKKRTGQFLRALHVYTAWTAEMDRKSLATASGCIRFTLATASDQNCCTNNYIRSGYFKWVWQLTLTLATASELWQLPLWQLPLTLATASDHTMIYS